MLRVNGLYGHIARNSAMSIVLLVGFVIAACALWVIAAMWGMLFATLLAFIVSIFLRKPAPLDFMMKLMERPEAFIQTFHIPVIVSVIVVAVGLIFLRRIIQSLTGARGVERLDEPRLYRIVETLAISVGLPTPRIEIIEQPGMNAYATGWSPRHATIAVTRGLLNGLNDRELEAVLAHEIAHIRNRDTRVMAIAALFGGLLSRVSETVWLVFLRRPMSLNDAFQVRGDAPGGRTDANEQTRRLRQMLLCALVFVSGPALLLPARLAYEGSGPLFDILIRWGVWVWLALCLWLAFGDAIKKALRGELVIEQRKLLLVAMIILVLIFGLNGPTILLTIAAIVYLGMTRSKEEPSSGADAAKKRSKSLVPMSPWQLISPLWVLN